MLVLSHSKRSKSKICNVDQQIQIHKQIIIKIMQHISLTIVYNEQFELITEKKKTDFNICCVLIT